MKTCPSKQSEASNSFPIRGGALGNVSVTKLRFTPSAGKKRHSLSAITPTTPPPPVPPAKWRLL